MQPRAEHEADRGRRIRHGTVVCHFLPTLGKSILIPPFCSFATSQDYTLSRYRTEFDLLAYNGAKKKLVDKGYPEDVLNFAYDPQRFTRGLVIDKRRGNIIKMDRHKYVRVAYHGFREISSEERKTLYSEYESFSGSNFVNMDTLFSLVDCTLFAHLIDYIDKNPEVLPSKNYEAIFRDIRDCVDICHRDGVIKDRVAEVRLPLLPRPAFWLKFV